MAITCFALRISYTNLANACERAAVAGKHVRVCVCALLCKFLMRPVCRCACHWCAQYASSALREFFIIKYILIYRNVINSVLAYIHALHMLQVRHTQALRALFMHFQVSVV